MLGKVVSPKNPKGTEGAKITQQHGVGGGMEQRAAQTEVMLVPLGDSLSCTRGSGGLHRRLCAVQKAPRRKGKVFQERGEEGEGRVTEVGWERR